LHGFVDYRNWENNPDKISFKENLKSNKAIYSPLTIKSFSVADEDYQSAIIETEVSPSNLVDLDHSSLLNIKIDTTFLQTMIKGPKSLYYYSKKFGKPQFYIKRDSGFELLMYKRYLFGPSELVDNKKFIGQLIFYFQDFPSIQSKIKNLEYSKKSLENLFIYYYKNTNSKVAFQKKTEKNKIEVGVLAGVSMSTLKFNHVDFSTLLQNSNFNYSTNFTTGLLLDFILPRNNNKLSIYNELIYTSFNISGSYNNSTTANGSTNTYTTFGYSYLKLFNMIRYIYPVGKSFIFLNAGISSGLNIGGSNSQRQETIAYNTSSALKYNAINEVRTFEQGYALGLGTKFDNCTIELRYERGTGLTNSQEIKSISNRFYFLFGVRF
jgi:hypothetical protein